MSEADLMSLEYVRRHYGVPAEIGRAVRYKGRNGVIVGGRNAHVGIVLEGDKASAVGYYHPKTEGLEYLGTFAKVPKLTRSQRRYKEYLNSECCESFRWWIMTEKSRKERYRED